MGSSAEFRVSVLLLLVSSVGNILLVSGGCSGKCCRGRDLSCVTTDWRMDRVYGTCFCDKSCDKTRDCCFDYFTECPAQDCLSELNEFLERPVCRVPAMPSRDGFRFNSGGACPNLIGKQRGLLGSTRDLRGEHCAHNAGPAFITSMEFGKGRPKHDKYGNPLDPGFCVEFTFQSRTPHCSVQNQPHTHWMRYITEGYKVCVACEPPAMKNNSGRCQGDGLQDDKEVLLHWQAVGNHQCSGTWKKIQKTQRCDCLPQHSFVFI
ncbi:somatomedin-B and thrombospondin type-1 domain-containing protein [Trematomus bernacchii]|uniref:somatomedin-B and thrombospondin type-1 domain-containing protein n=1 Tax=Trematomus bernacchii TaxID=40690 RepID=UPI00146F7897|nr:somatomedin-B and thrombospondin type-1 domain-containing protein [Trematomus bernacchii]